MPAARDRDNDIASLNAQMIAELQTDPAFTPSAFWSDINDKNVKMLLSDGLENFKRTISHNYYSWLILNPLAAHFVHIFRDWLRHPSMKPLRTRIEKPLSVRLTTQAERMSLSAYQRFLYRLYVSGVWHKMLRTDVLNLAPQMTEPELGNPIRIWHDGKIITQDLANSIIEANVMAKFLGDTVPHPRVAELGAGSGRLAHVFATTHSGTYYIFDIPPALIVSQWYLERVLQGKRIFRFRRFDAFEDIQDELNSADVAFFTANQMATFPPHYFDMVVSISTLPELTPRQVNMFLTMFQHLSK